ncbi:hypothetical protein MBANPS3_006846 [Mucor bainieri]
MKRLTTERTNRRSIETLQHSDTNATCTTPDALQDAARRYYEILYTPTPIPPSDRIPDTSHAAMCAPFTADDLLTGATRSPHKSSPGMDGLPDPDSGPSSV